MMPEEPNKSEELLQRYAKQRREQGGDFSLHPATRRLLQGEVTRTYGAKKAGTAKGSWLAWLASWPGRAAIGTVAAVLIVVAVLVVNRDGEVRLEQRMELARLSEAAPEADVMFREAEQASPATPAAAEEKLNRLGALDEREVRADAPAADKKELGDTASLAMNAPKAVAAPAEVRLFDFDGAANFANDFALSLVPADATNTALHYYVDAFGVNEFSLSSTTPPLHFYSYWFDASAGATNARVLGPMVAGRGVDPLSMAATAAFGAEQATAPQRSKLSRDAVNGSRVVATATPPPPASIAPSPALSAEPGNAPGRPEMLLGSRAQPQEPARALDSLADLSSAQRFYRVATPDGEAAGLGTANSPRVLSSFVIEQTGETVRVIDGDGSVYVGSLQATAEDRVGGTSPRNENEAVVREQLSRGQVTPAIQAGEAFTFQAVGSNVTLRQRVEVRGRFISNATNLAQTGGATALGAVATAGAGVTEESKAEESRRNVARSRAGIAGTFRFTTNQAAAVEGTVRIGTSTNQQRFRAIRQSPQP